MKMMGAVISTLATAAIASSAVYMMTSNKPAVRKMRRKATKATKNMIKNNASM